MARNNKEKSPYEIFMELKKEEYADTFGRPKAKHQGDDLTWEEFLAHELFNTARLLDWYEERDREEIEEITKDCCGGECGCTNCGEH